jgi:hypothetical protein
VRRQDLPDHKPTFDLRFTDTGLGRDPLADFIRQRSVQRRPMRLRALSVTERSALEAAVGAPFRICWMEGFRGRLRAASLLFRNAKLRLTLPEAFEVHQRIIAWDATESTDRIPDQALGASPVTLKLMRLGLGSWQRVHFANRFLAGTWVPRIELDFIPSLACAAHFAILAPREPAGVDDMIAAGKAVQRFWLTATQLELWQQPEMTPLIFARYARRGVRFTRQAGLLDQARQLASRLDRLLGDGSHNAIWMGRLGAGPAPTARSTRLPLAQLLTESGSAQKYQVPRT